MTALEMTAPGMIGLEMTGLGMTAPEETDLEVNAQEMIVLGMTDQEMTGLEMRDHEMTAEMIAETTGLEMRDPVTRDLVMNVDVRNGHGRAISLVMGTGQGIVGMKRDHGRNQDGDHVKRKRKIYPWRVMNQAIGICGRLYQII